MLFFFIQKFDKMTNVAPIQIRIPLFYFFFFSFSMRFLTCSHSFLKLVFFVNLGFHRTVQDLEGLKKGSTVCQEMDQTRIFVSFYPKAICMMASLILCCIVFHSSSPLNPYCKLIEVHLHVMKLHGDKRKRQMRLLERGKGEY